MDSIMKKIALIITCALTCIGVQAQTGKEWDDPLITSVI